MTSRTFLDTNVVVYAVDTNEPGKQQAAIAAIEALDPGTGVLSTQVLVEFYVTATRKLVHPLTHEEGAAAVARLASFDVVVHDAPLVRCAVDLGDRARISLWDALIVAGCGTSWVHNNSHRGPERRPDHRRRPH